MRTRERLIFVIESLNEPVVGSWTYHAFASAARHLREGEVFNPVTLSNMRHIAAHDPRDHMRSLASSALAHNDEMEALL